MWACVLQVLSRQVMDLLQSLGELGPAGELVSLDSVLRMTEPVVDPDRRKPLTW